MGLSPSFVRYLINHAVQLQVELDQFFVQVHDMVVVSHKTYNAAQAAKVIGTGRTRLLQFMRHKGGRASR